MATKKETAKETEKKTKAAATKTAKKEAPAKAIIVKRSKSFNGDLSDVECMKLTGLSRNTYYKYKREIRYSMS